VPCSSTSIPHLSLGRIPTVDAAALRQVAQLFRTFGEDYHERMLEEQHIFPVIRKRGGALQRYVDILTDQHNRGREITDYV
jgi:hemerythrin-like domain-containing protein